MSRQSAECRLCVRHHNTPSGPNCQPPSGPNCQRLCVRHDNKHTICYRPPAAPADCRHLYMFIYIYVYIHMSHDIKHIIRCSQLSTYTTTNTSSTSKSSTVRISILSRRLFERVCHARNGLFATAQSRPFLHMSPAKIARTHRLFSRQIFERVCHARSGGHTLSRTQRTLCDQGCFSRMSTSEILCTHRIVSRQFPERACHAPGRLSATALSRPFFRMSPIVCTFRNFPRHLFEMACHA